MSKRLIYAEDAIDAVTSSVMEWDEMYVQDLNVRISEAIQQLPSAQPYTDKELQKIQDLEQSQFDKMYDLGYQAGRAAQPEIIRCKDCKHKPTLDEDGEPEFPTGRCPCQCQDFYYSWMPKDDWFCANAERRTDE